MEKEKIVVARNCEPEGSPSEYLGAEVSMGLLTAERITKLKSMLQNDKLFVKISFFLQVVSNNSEEEI